MKQKMRNWKRWLRVTDQRGDGKRRSRTPGVKPARVLCAALAALWLAGCAPQTYPGEADTAAERGVTMRADAGGPLLPEAPLSEAHATESTVQPLSVQAEPRGDGYSIDKGITEIKWENGTAKLSIANVNGTIDLRQGTGRNIEIRTLVTVPHATAEQAEAVAGLIRLDIAQDAELNVKVKGQSYNLPQGKLSYPVVDLTVTLPKGMEAAVQAAVTNGDVFVTGLTDPDKLELSSVNGSVEARDNAAALWLRTENGTIVVENADGQVDASLVNGSIEASRVKGDLKLEAVTGSIWASEVSAALQAKVVTGEVDVSSATVGGDWDLSSGVGYVEVAFPEAADVQVEGRMLFGKPESEFSLDTKIGRVSGKLGKGTFRIDITSMTGLSLKKLQ